MKKKLVLIGWMAVCLLPRGHAVPGLEEGFREPPVESRVRAYWWWLNGNVTREAITRDLEEMKAKGFGGALICDAGGAEQDGNDRVPAGPPFFSKQWRELYRHALLEADRLGLEMSLNMQSGWNLGGPMVRPEDAPKKLVWSETEIAGGDKQRATLPEPQHPAEFYRDIAVLAWPLKEGRGSGVAPPNIRSSSDGTGHPAGFAVDGDLESFWVSAGNAPGEGPTREKPQWLQLDFEQPVAPLLAVVRGRPGYGPRVGEWRASDDGKEWRERVVFDGGDKEEILIRLRGTPAKHFRLIVFGSSDPRFPENPRNVQVAEINLLGGDGKAIFSAARTLRFWAQKALHRGLGRSAPSSSPLFETGKGQADEEDARASEVMDLTGRLGAGGMLDWEAPPGRWRVLRLGCAINDHCKVSTSSDGWQGYALDPVDEGLFRRYWAEIVDPLISDAGPLAGRTLKYLHTDSWEIEVFNWTPAMREEFRARRGYDPLPYYPVLAGRIIGGREESERFLHDYRKTVGDLVADRHFALFGELARARGLAIHPESGGPHGVPIDSLRCLGLNDVPMSEFWARSWRHRTADEDRFFVKQPASAAHANGRPLVAAEGFTTIGPHWQETPRDNLKPAFDRAACEGFNMLFWHAFTCSPKEMGLPGQEYFAGTHFNPNATWWNKSGPFLTYLNRCQHILRRGLFVADVCYYYGDHVPNFARLKSEDPARLLPGYDYDIVTERVLLDRASARDGRIALPDGMSYRLLVLPDLPGISLPVLRKVKELVTGGATVIGKAPRRELGLTGYPACDDEVRALARELWGEASGESGENRRGTGRVIWGRTAREVLAADGVPPDFEAAGDPALDYIHRREGETEIYFLANGSGNGGEVRASFRVAGRAPEFWDPLTGETRDLPVWKIEGGRTVVPLRFEPWGSMFVLFRRPAAQGEGAIEGSNFTVWQAGPEIDTPWRVTFDPAWGGPAEATFPKLTSWTERPEEGIRHYSGIARYHATFTPPAGFGAGGQRVALDLGEVREIAQVWLNGEDLGVWWAAPPRKEITGSLRPGENRLEIEVVNFWPNRVIGDARLPENERKTKTNIRKLTADTPLVPSGLLGPVRLSTAPAK